MRLGVLFCCIFSMVSIACADELLNFGVDIALKASDIDRLGSAKQTVRDSAITDLVSDGPLRLEEIQRASRSLNEILEMREKLMTPHRDFRVGFARHDDEQQVAIDYFVKHDGVKWLIEVLETQDDYSRSLVSVALVKLGPEIRQANARLLVSACLPILQDPDQLIAAGSEHPGEVALIELNWLVADLIDLKPGPPPSIEDEEALGNLSKWKTDARRTGQAAFQWLATDRAKRG